MTIRTRLEAAARELPDGMKLVAGVGRGPFEWATRLMGVQGLSLALYRQPDLVARVFDKLGELVLAANRHLAPIGSPTSMNTVMTVPTREQPHGGARAQLNRGILAPEALYST